MPFQCRCDSCDRRGPDQTPFEIFFSHLYRITAIVAVCGSVWFAANVICWAYNGFPLVGGAQ